MNRFFLLALVALAVLPACSMLSGEAEKTADALKEELASEGPRPESVECDKNADVKLSGNGADVYDCRVEYAGAQTEAYCAGWFGGALAIKQGNCRGSSMTEPA